MPSDYLNRIKKVFGIKLLIIILIFLSFSFFRFYNLGGRIGFDWDQEQFSTQIRQIVKDKKLTLIGPRVTSDKGFFLAPYFTYLLIPFYLASNLHPSGLIFFLIFFNTAFFFISFYIIKKLFGFGQAVFFLLFWTFNSLLVNYDIVPWWPIFIPLGVLVVWLILLKLYQKNTCRQWILLGLTLGFFCNMHFQFAFLVVFSSFFIFFSRRKIVVDIKRIVAGIFSFFATLTPLLLFDLRHKFLNMRLFFNFFTHGIDDQKLNPTIWFSVFTNLIKPLIYTDSFPITIAFYMLIFLLIFYLYRKKSGFNQSFYLSSLLLWVIFPFIFSKYGRRPSEYYFVFLYPFIYIVIIDFIFLAKRKYIALLIGALIFFINRDSLINGLKTSNLGLYYKDKIIQELQKQTIGKKFNVSYSTPLGRDTGFKYLIDYYQIKQSGDWNDPLVQIQIPSENCEIRQGSFGLIIPQELKNEQQH